MNFLLDVQLPPRLVAWMEERGHKAVHACDIPQGLTLPDAVLWDIATQDGKILVTKDKDFFDLSLLRGSPPRVLLLKYGNCSTNDLMRMLGEAWSQVIDILGRADTRLVVLARDKIEVYSGGEELGVRS